MTQAFALAGHEAWKNYRWDKDEDKVMFQPFMGAEGAGGVISTISPENLLRSSSPRNASQPYENVELPQTSRHPENAL